MAEPKTPETEKTKLLSKRDELLARLKEINRDYRQGLEADSEERAIQLENADVLEGIAKATVEELERIEELLKKLD
jgi:hypothetical protein